MSIPCAFSSHLDAKKAGWFSRRHQTPAEHYAAQERWRTERAEKAERENAQHTATIHFRQRRSVEQAAALLAARKD